jgi:hypothetical protein
MVALAYPQQYSAAQPLRRAQSRVARKPRAAARKAVEMAALGGAATSLVCLGMSALLAWGTAPAAPTEYATVVARQGDSLWKWAQAYPSRGYMLDRIEMIAQENGMKPGQPLLLGHRYRVPVRDAEMGQLFLARLSR